MWVMCDMASQPWIWPMLSKRSLPEHFVMNAEIENDDGGNPQQKPEDFHRAHLSQPAKGQVITISP